MSFTAEQWQVKHRDTLVAAGWPIKAAWSLAQSLYPSQPERVTDDPATLPAFPTGALPCGHEHVQMIEGGYTRRWLMRVDADGVSADSEGGGYDFSDDGDGAYWCECSTCLTRYALPEDWEWN